MSLFEELKKIGRECDEMVAEVEKLRRQERSSSSRSEDKAKAIGYAEEIQSEMIDWQEKATELNRSLQGDVKMRELLGLADSLLSKNEKMVERAVKHLSKTGFTPAEDWRISSPNGAETSIESIPSSFAETPEVDASESICRHCGSAKNSKRATICGTPAQTPLNTTFTSDKKPYPRVGIPIIRKQRYEDPDGPSVSENELTGSLKKWSSSPALDSPCLQQHRQTKHVSSTQKQLSSFGSHNSLYDVSSLIFMKLPEMPKLHTDLHEMYCPDITQTMNSTQFMTTMIQTPQVPVRHQTPGSCLSSIREMSPLRDITQFLGVQGTTKTSTPETVTMKETTATFNLNLPPTPVRPELSDFTKKILEEFNLNSKMKVDSVRKHAQLRSNKKPSRYE